MTSAELRRSASRTTAAWAGTAEALLGALTTCPPDHELDDLVHGGRGRLQRAHVGSVPQHGDPVGDVHDLVHAVGDVDDGHAPLPQAAHALEELGALRLRQGRGRLVEDEHLGLLEGQRPGDLHDLGLADRQVPQGRARVDADLVVVDERLGAAVQVAVGDPQRGGLPAYEDVLRDRQIGHHVELLMDDRDARLLGVADGTEPCGRALVLVDAGEGGVDAGDDLDQRRLPGAVLADEGVDLPWSEVQGDSFESLHAWEGLGDVLHVQARLNCHVCSIAWNCRNCRNCADPSRGAGPGGIWGRRAGLRRRARRRGCGTLLSVEEPLNHKGDNDVIVGGDENDRIDRC